MVCADRHINAALNNAYSLVFYYLVGIIMKTVVCADVHINAASNGCFGNLLNALERQWRKRLESQNSGVSKRKSIVMISGCAQGLINEKKEKRVPEGVIRPWLPLL